MTRDEAAEILSVLLDEKQVDLTDSEAEAIRTILTHGYAPPDKVIVPREPTGAMVDRATTSFRGIGQTDATAIYRAMISAADKEQQQ